MMKHPRSTISSPFVISPKASAVRYLKTFSEVRLQKFELEHHESIVNPGLEFEPTRLAVHEAFSFPTCF